MNQKNGASAWLFPSITNDLIALHALRTENIREIVLYLSCKMGLRCQNGIKIGLKNVANDIGGHASDYEL